MRKLIDTVGAGRLIGIAFVLGIVLGAMVAVPLLVSADEPEAEEPAEEWPEFGELFERFEDFPDGEAFDEFEERMPFADVPLFGTWEFSEDEPFGGVVERIGIAFSGLETVAELTGTDPEEVLEAMVAGQSLADYAAEHGVSEEELVDALVAEYEEKINELVDEGRLDQEQADELLADAEERIASMVQHEGFLGGAFMPDNFEEPRFDGPFGRHMFGVFPNLDTVAELTGTDRDDVVTALRDGQSLADYAAEYGVSEDELVDSLVADVEERLNERVEDGDLDQAEADEMLQDVEERMTELVNREGFGFPGPHEWRDCIESDEESSTSV